MAGSLATTDNLMAGFLPTFYNSMAGSLPTVYKVCDQYQHIAKISGINNVQFATHQYNISFPPKIDRFEVAKIQ